MLRLGIDHGHGNTWRLLLAFCCAAVIVPAAARAGVNYWTSNGPAGAWVNALAIDPTNAATIYAGANGVFKSTDSGEHWGDVGVDAVRVNALAIHRTPPNTICLATGYGFPEQGVYRSTDGGQRWRAPTQSEFVSDLVIDPRRPTTLYAAYSAEGSGVTRSADAGDT